MDWPTGLGLIMGIIATADLAYKYGSALFKKIHLRPRAGKSDTLSKKSSSRLIGSFKKVRRATTLQPRPLRFCNQSAVYSGLYTFSLKKI